MATLIDMAKTVKIGEQKTFKRENNGGSFAIVSINNMFNSLSITVYGGNVDQILYNDWKDGE